MMKLLTLPLFALALATSMPTARAADESTAAIEALGRLNGVALACNQPALVTRARNIIVTGAPKTRSVGETFENATNAAYLEQGKGAACPDAGSLASNIAAAEKRLQTAFPKN
jgi:hypothetical protein